MKKQDAEVLLPLVNDVKAYDELQYYVNMRIAVLHKSLETLTDIETIYKVQGQIQELRRFETLREEVKNPSDMKVKKNNYGY